MIELAIHLIVTIVKKYEGVAALHNEVRVFLQYVKHLQPILENVGKQQEAFIQVDTRLSIAFVHLQSAVINDGVNVLQQCVSESRNRQLKWRAKNV